MLLSPFEAEAELFAVNLPEEGVIARPPATLVYAGPEKCYSMLQQRCMYYSLPCTWSTSLR